MPRIGRGYPVSSLRPKVVRPTAVLTQVIFDSVAAGTSTVGTSSSHTHTAALNSYAIQIIATGNATSVMTASYGGSAMTLLGTVDDNNINSDGSLYVFGKAVTTGGLNTSAASWTGSSWYYSTTISYRGVASIGTPVTTNGSGSALSQGPVAAPPAGGVILQIFGQGSGASGAFTSLSGGINRFNQYGSFAGLAINEASASATFVATGSASDTWSGLALALIPIPSAVPSGSANFFVMF
jgi:hypothetical protein